MLLESPKGRVPESRARGVGFGSLGFKSLGAEFWAFSCGMSGFFGIKSWGSIDQLFGCPHGSARVCQGVVYLYIYVTF